MFSMYICSSPMRLSSKSSILLGARRDPRGGIKTENLAARVQAGNQQVDVSFGGVDAEAGAGGAVQQAQRLQQRHGAMMTAADADALGVENGGDVVRMDAFDRERHGAGTIRVLGFRLYVLGTDD